MTPTDFKFAQTLEQELLKEKPVIVNFSGNKYKFYQKILSIKTKYIQKEEQANDVALTPALYDEVLEEDVKELDISELSSFRPYDHQTDEILETYKRLLKFAKNIHYRKSPDLIQKEFFNYMFNIHEQAICIFFNIPCTNFNTFLGLCEEQNVFNSIKNKITEELIARAAGERQKIAAELEVLSNELDEETFKAAKEHTESIYEWLKNIVQEVNLNQFNTINKMLEAWPVVFNPAPWELPNAEV